MATFTKLKFSGSTDGRGIKVVATTTPGTTIHTASTNSAEKDEVWIYAYNGHTAAVVLTIQFGGTTSPDDDVKVTVPAQAGLYLVIPGTILVGNATALIVKAFAATANVIVIHGWVNRISE